jgi:hypothetical protein
MITSGKELDTRQKIERSKASASYIDPPSRQSAGNRRKDPIASDKLVRVLFRFSGRCTGKINIAKYSVTPKSYC